MCVNERWMIGMCVCDVCGWKGGEGGVMVCGEDVDVGFIV